MYSCSGFAVVLLTETKVFRNFLMLSLSICLLQQIFLQSRELTWTANLAGDILLMKNRLQHLHSQIMTDPFVGKRHISVYTPVQ